uniref:Velvet domain-containing protein n=2 Tax=Kalmanozyma brasiliensis (strain GHG001) TaxID=1365824 RepID=V5EES5_KALBG
MLYGTLVAGPQMHKAPPGEEDVEKPYFFFPEISVRATGKFRIVCRLMRLPLPGISAIEEGVLASVETNTFEVVERANFMAPYITDVSRHFARQGVPLLLPPGVSAD